VFNIYGYRKLWINKEDKF